MTDISALEKRLSDALERIATGAGNLAQATGGGDADALQAALEDEKMVVAQLEERVKVLTKRQDDAVAEARAAAEAAEAQVSQLDLELQRLRRSNDQLRQSNQALREANEAGVGEPHLINKAMLAELEALRAARAADVAEAPQIIAAMTPLLDAAKTEGSDHA